MQFARFLILLLFAVIPGLRALDVVGPCRTLPVVQNFDVTKYMGTWYEIQRYPHRNQPNGDCGVINYTLNQTSGEVAVLNVMQVLAEQKTVEAHGVAVADPDYPGQGVLRVRFEETPPEVPPSYYRVLDVAYDRYSVVWSCRGDGANSIESAWVLSRAVQLDSVSAAAVKAIIDQHLDHDSFITPKQGEEFCGGAASLTTSIMVFMLSIFAVFKSIQN